MPIGVLLIFDGRGAGGRGFERAWRAGTNAADWNVVGAIPRSEKKSASARDVSSAGVCEVASVDAETWPLKPVGGAAL